MRCKDLLRFNKQVHVPLHLSLLSNLFQFNYSNNINRNYTSLTLCYNCHFPIQTLFHNQNLSLPTLQSPYITISSFAQFLKTPKTLPMTSSQITILALLISFFFTLVYGNWQNGHATFYGGGDASGTMGIFTYISF